MMLALVVAAAGAAEAMPEQLLFEANTAYEAGEHATAVARYRALIDAGVDNGYVYYNLGNALLRDGRLGPAIASYRKARALLPRDSDIRANLAYARNATKDAIAPHDPSVVWRTLFFWHFSLSARELLILLLVLNLLFWGTLVVHHVRRRSELLRWAVALSFLALVVTGASYVIRTVDPPEIAVVTNYEVEVRSGISRDTVVRFKLHEGTEAEALEVEDDWVRIALPDGKQGWVERQDVLLVTL